MGSNLFDILEDVGEILQGGLDTAQDFAENLNPFDKPSVGDLDMGAQVTTLATEEVLDEEEAGDELAKKLGTEQGIPIVYGTRRVGGILVYQEVEADTYRDHDGTTRSDLLNLHQCWVLAEGVQQEWTVLVDDVSLALSKYVLQDDGTGGTSNFTSSYNRATRWIRDRLIWTNGWLGGDSGSKNWGSGIGNDAGIQFPNYRVVYPTSLIHTAGASWLGSDSGQSHKMKGIACEQITYRHHWDHNDSFIDADGNRLTSNYPYYVSDAFGPANGSTKGVDVWKSGMPKLAFDMTGMAIVDNAGNAKLSSDPSWILYDYLTNSRYGCSIPTGEIDTTSFATASTICNQTNSGTKRHSCNIIIDTLQPLLTNVRRILVTCNGRLHWINGKYTIKIDDVYTGSGEFNFLEKHIIGGISIVGDSKGQRLNQVTAKFINPANKWKSDEVRYPDKNNEASVYNSFLTADANIRSTKTINVGGVTNYNQARYLAKQACLRSRDSVTVSFTSTAEAMNVIVGDVVTLTHSTPAWNAKEFLVRSISLIANGNCSLTCIEHNDAIYAWDTVGIPTNAPNTTLPDPASVIAPTNLTLTTKRYTSIASAGTRISAELDWDSTGGFTSFFDAEYKKSSDSIYIDGGRTNSKSIVLQDFESGIFDFRVRAVNSIGSVSDWTTITNQEMASVTPIPPDVENFFVSINSSDANTILATWDAPTTVDLKAGGYIEIRNLMSGSSTWQEAEHLTNVGSTTTSVLLPIMTGDYVAKWVSSEGSESVNHVTSSLGSVFWTNTVETVNLSPNYSGILSDLFVADNDGTKLLKFVSTGFFDDFAEIDDWTSRVDEKGGTKTTGTYISDAHDLGSAFEMRIGTDKTYTASISDVSNYMDTWTKVDLRGSWDDIAGLAGVTTFISTTLDDPASAGATFTDFKQFQIANVKARGFKIKTKFDSDQAGAEQFRMSQLSALIDMDEKIVGVNDLTSTSVSYATPFFARPNLIVMPKNLGSGEYMTLTSETASGFNVNFFNSSDGAISRTYNYQAKGV